MNYTDYSYQRMRDRDFMKAVRRTTGEMAQAFPTVAEVTSRAAKAPAPSYYVGMTYGIRALRRIRRTGHLPWNGRGAGRRWAEIVARVDACRARHGVSDTEALARVLAYGHASSFFIEPSSALRLYHRLRRRHRKEGRV